LCAPITGELKIYFTEGGTEMASKNFDLLADQILLHVGGKENITYLAHCMTRLRMTLKENSLADIDALKALDGVMGTQWAGEQLQIIIGQKVPDLYEIVRKKGELDHANAINENVDGEKKEKLTPKVILGKCLDGLTGSLAPLIPLLIAGGMLKLVGIVGAQLGLLDSASNTGAMLNFWGDAAFYFMPVFVGGFAAKKFGSNTGLGMMLGAALIYPSFVTMISEGTPITLFGFPVYSASYASTLLPAVLCVWVMSYVEKFFAKYSPAVLRAMLEPFCTMLVMLPLSMWVLAPVATIVGNVVGVGLNWLMGSFGFIGLAIIGAVWPILIVAGMHVGLLPFVLQQLASFGYMTINIPGFTNNFAQGAACLGVALRTNDKNLRAESITCAVTALTGGISEPAIFGICLQKRTPLYASMIGNAVGGAIAGITGCKMFFFTAAGGILGLPAFIGDSAGNLISFIAASAATMVVTFLMTMVLYKPEAAAETSGAGKAAAVDKSDTTAALPKAAALKSPLTGKVVPLSDVPDQTFSEGILGLGAAIIPSEGKVYSPVDGEISSVVDSRHAVGVKADSGAEILIHIGLDTVQLGGEGFTYHIREGQKIHTGDLLISCDLDLIKSKGYNTVTPVLVSNSDDYTAVQVIGSGEIKSGEPLLSVE